MICIDRARGGCEDEAETGARNAEVWYAREVLGATAEVARSKARRVRA